MVLAQRGVAAFDGKIGSVIDGRYRIEAKIGEGGMGIVYRAVHTVLGKKLALKVLRADMAQDPQVVKRFIQEAQSASGIGHENIIDISDFGQMADGSVYFVMEYLDGRALSDLVQQEGALSIQQGLSIARQIASALAAAHARGIVHRDLKPDNVLVSRKGERRDFVKVLDFGIAKVNDKASKLTAVGTLFGTPHYMSPEQAGGKDVDHRTDIYALGVMMYEMFTGRLPFDADSLMQVLSKQMFQTPEPPSKHLGGRDKLGSIEDIILHAMQKDPEKRYQTMDALQDDLDRVLSGQAPRVASDALPIEFDVEASEVKPRASRSADTLDPPPSADSARLSQEMTLGPMELPAGLAPNSVVRRRVMIGAAVGVGIIGMVLVLALVRGKEAAPPTSSDSVAKPAVASPAVDSAPPEPTGKSVAPAPVAAPAPTPVRPAPAAAPASAAAGRSLDAAPNEPAAPPGAGRDVVAAKVDRSANKARADSDAEPRRSRRAPAATTDDKATIKAKKSGGRGKKSGSGDSELFDPWSD